MEANPEVQTDIITLTRFILQEQNKVGASSAIPTGDFTLLLNSLQFAFKFIAHNIRRSTLVNLIGLSGTANSTGDDQKKLDVIGDEIFINAMKASGKVKLVVSEEQEDLIVFEGDGRYAVVCDPIDGSSNLDAGVSVGTIFGVYKLPEGSSGSIKDVLRPGKEMVAAGYTMYGASANLVLSTGNGCNGFTLDDPLGEFILTHPDLKLPDLRSIYSVNEGNSSLWSDNVKDYFKALKFPEDGSKPYSARYIGSMVADVHRTILYGGMFAYPADSKSKKGKLRLLYEGFPMAYIIEQAGGLAINDNGERILDLVPTEIHERSGVWLGSKGEIEKAKKYLLK
ncbi:fructose-1,6-bisphosphatase class 1/Sedoheputulose-1,7-bisphosphatase [Yarrowia lipolytica]|jgi:fructose-1,6-bisphosphatase I|uniref:Fructose-1,6-bisphosphatase n=2 Tax=Yarrowia lipolytica TaxID=4952 RepID=Q6CGV1_YARLI|nr:YALI0A15972p [Yarrowia lipolytica CLIB122]KAG5361790.1 Fructose-1,6-bisphosphatase [Yarrowia sp. E02]KAG5369722.1 Fructose-1,6-bisphosphatase [Yarrowia sp. C11]QNP95252.1 Fructose-1,6-bisphosphatase [Yarrowia lipolytica]RDW25577.1 fructose-1,6-bisphosphatase class 1/Sedoheputulose-1,7-bisphosphatase [Yarrowia lipolytica]RDW32336.1 fructose-1,6-bisphosphatase class 1/Sedoheputulose-1,7-bisphosphatase [Yarrowia lipolytica]|eukprot:XP_500111.1 YALI0A15972p [Yarrowia lipolytica CLIB122]